VQEISSRRQIQDHRWPRRPCRGFPPLRCGLVDQSQIAPHSTDESELGKTLTYSLSFAGTQHVLYIWFPLGVSLSDRYSHGALSLDLSRREDVADGTQESLRGSDQSSIPVRARVEVQHPRLQRTMVVGR